MRGFAARVLVAAAIAIVPALARAQCTADGNANCFQNGSVSMTAVRVIRLQMSAASTTLTPPTATDFDAGSNVTAGPTLTVSANSAWTLHIRAGTPLWTAVNTTPGVLARTNKPAADLLWGKANVGPFTAFTVSDVNFATGTATASNVTTLFLQTLYGWTLDTPGTYSLSVVLTLTSP